MMRATAVAALLVTLAALAGCGGVPMVVMGGLASAGSIYRTVDQVTEATAPVIARACGEFEKAKAAAGVTVAVGLVAPGNAVKLASITSFGDAACAHPPGGDPIATAIWLGQLGGQLAALAAPRGS